MDEYNEKRASPLTLYTFSEISINLSVWRDILREELETLIYIKNCLSLNDDNSTDGLTQEQKIKNLIPKLEALCLKEIDCINEVLSSVLDNKYVEKSEKLYSKVESIRDNYNKIIVNIQKMINSVPYLKEFKQKYLNSVLPKEKDIRTISQLEEDNSYNSKIDQIKKSNSQKKPYVQSAQEITTNSNNSLSNNNNLVKDQWIEGINKDLNELNNKKLTKTYSEKDSIAMRARAFNKNEENKSESISRNSLKNKSSKKPMRNGSITPISNNNTIKKQLNTTNTQLTYNNNIDHNQSINKQNTIDKEAIRVLSEEIKHIKSYYEELNQKVRELCILNKQKKEFDQIKKENIKLIADVSILKEDMLDLMKCYQKLSHIISTLQVDNENLKQQNKNLLAYISNGNDNEVIRQLENNSNMLFNSNDLMFSNTMQDNNDRPVINYNKNSEEISELSAFDSHGMASNANYNNGRNTHNQGFINMNATNLSELTRLNMTITNNTKNVTPISNKQRRFLINKD